MKYIDNLVDNRKMRTIHPLLFLIVMVILGGFITYSIVNFNKEEAYSLSIEIYEKLSRKICLKENRSKCSFDVYGNLNKTPELVIGNVSLYFSDKYRFMIIKGKDFDMFYSFGKDKICCSKYHSEDSSICLNITNIKENLKYIPEYTISLYSIEFTRKEFESEIKKYNFLDLIVESMKECILRKKRSGCILIYKNVSLESFNAVFDIVTSWGNPLFFSYGLENIKNSSYYPLEIHCCFLGGKLNETNITLRKTYFINRRYYGGFVIRLLREVVKDEDYFTIMDRKLRIRIKILEHKKSKDLKKNRDIFLKKFIMPMLNLKNKELKLIVQNESGKTEIVVTPSNQEKYENLTKK